MPDVAATSTFKVDFRRPRPVPAVEPLPGRDPRVARLLALAHQIDLKIRAGELKDLAHAAKVCGVTRGRMTQVMNLLLLAREIQETILAWPSITKGRDPITERHLRPIVAEPLWDCQMSLWRRLREDTL